jgi:hypothetical protein
MPSITRRSRVCASYSVLALTFCALLAAPVAAASPFDKGAATARSFWTEVVETWDSILDHLFAPTAMVLDPNGFSQDAGALEDNQPTATLDEHTA